MNARTSYIPRALSLVMGSLMALSGGNVLAANEAAPVVPVGLVDLGNRHIGDSALSGLTVVNQAPSGSDGATASFLGISGDALTNGGVITSLAPGASDDNSLQIGIDTSLAGHRSGVATVSLGTDGSVSGSPRVLASSDVTVQGDVYRLASPVIGERANGTIFSPDPGLDVSVPTENAFVGEQIFATLSIGNNALSDDYSERLDARLGPVTGALSATMSNINVLEAGDRIDGAITVVLDTSHPGLASGEAFIDFLSNGDGIDGLGQTVLGQGRIQFGTTVIGEARGVVSPDPLHIDARVGDTAEGFIAVENDPLAGPAADLDVDIATSGDAQLRNSPYLEAIGTADVGVGLDTSTAGMRHGRVDFTMHSNGERQQVGHFGAEQHASVEVLGNVYAPAVAEVQPSGSVDFGVVHVGDAVAQSITVSNVAQGALTDVLRGGIASVPAPFSVSGNLGSGVAAGDTSSLQVALDTSTAGAFDGNARLDLFSHNDDMTDVALAAVDLALTAQVNEHANPIFSQNSAVPVTGGGTEYLLDFGNVPLGDAVRADLVVVNYLVKGNREISNIDLVDGSFDLTGSGLFDLLGFHSFQNLANSNSGIIDLVVSLDSAGLAPGVVQGEVILLPEEHNASGYRRTLDPIRLRLRANLVPLPTTLMLWVLGLAVGRYRLFRNRGLSATS